MLADASRASTYKPYYVSKPMKAPLITAPIRPTIEQILADKEEAIRPNTMLSVKTIDPIHQFF